MKKILLFSTLVLSLLSCKGRCEDPKALNYDWKLFSRKDNSLCEFSKGIFYVSGPANYPPLSLYVDGNYVGNISMVYPNGPGNCSASGCPTYQFTSGESVDWEVRDAVGNVVSGTLSPNSASSCIKVRVY